MLGPLNLYSIASIFSTSFVFKRHGIVDWGSMDASDIMSLMCRHLIGNG